MDEKQAPKKEEIKPLVRQAICKQCRKTIVKSEPDLAFFEPKPVEQYDLFYCGECYGWD